MPSLHPISGLFLPAAVLIAGCGSSNSPVAPGPVTPLSALLASTAQVQFMSNSVGGFATTQAFSLTNPNSVGVPTGISLAGTNAGDFGQTNTCGATLGAGAQCTVTVAFSPSATGSRSAAVNIVGASQAVAITGGATAGANMTSYVGKCLFPETVCIASFASAIYDAGTYLAANPNAPYTISVNSGYYDFSDNTTGVMGSLGSAISFNGIDPTTGSLNIQGQGSATTTLVTAYGLTQFNGQGISHIHISGFTLRRNKMTTTMGTVVSVSPGIVVLNIPAGFPLETDLFVADTPGAPTQPGRYLRVFDNTNPKAPIMNGDATNTQIPFGAPTVAAPTCDASRNCTFTLNNSKLVAPAIYTQPNMVVGVKSEGGGQAYFFSNLGQANGMDVGFNDIVWYDSARGVWRNITAPYVTNSAIRRRDAINGQVPAMSTAAGGPQFGQPGDLYPLANIVVNNVNFEATGDDSIAIFNDTTNTSTLQNLTIDSGFARTVNLYNSCHVQLLGNILQTLTNCQPAINGHNVPTTYQGCVTDTTPAPTPCGNTL